MCGACCARCWPVLQGGCTCVFMSHLTVGAHIVLLGITAACSINPHYTIGVITLPALHTCHICATTDCMDVHECMWLVSNWTHGTGGISCCDPCPTQVSEWPWRVNHWPYLVAPLALFHACTSLKDSSCCRGGGGEWWWVGVRRLGPRHLCRTSNTEEPLFEPRGPV